MKTVQLPSTSIVECAHGRDRCQICDDPPRIVVHGTVGYYMTGRIDAHGCAHNHGGYFHRKRDAISHAKELAREYGLPWRDETAS